MTKKTCISKARTAEVTIGIIPERTARSFTTVTELLKTNANAKWQMGNSDATHDAHIKIRMLATMNREYSIRTATQPEVQRSVKARPSSVRSLEKMLLNMSFTFPLKLRHAIQLLRHGLGDCRQTVIAELRSKLGFHRGTTPLRRALALSLCSYSHRTPDLVTRRLWGTD